MKQPRRPDAPPRKPRRRWRWHVPPAIVHGAEALEGTEILSEYTGELGLVFWQSVRDISLWSSITPPEGRAGLFSPSASKRRAASLLAADPDEAVTGPLATITGILDDPAGTESEQVMLACREISQWADARGTLATALAFAQAGAFACPGNAAAGYRVGQLAKRRGEWARAETWLRRTIGLARQARDWTSYAEAFLSLGNLYLVRGNLPVSRQLQIRAFRAAKRHSLRNVQAGALHNLFAIAAQSGRFEEAEAHARAAFEAYPPEHPFVPTFAGDVAYFWVKRGQFAPALAVIKSILPFQKVPDHRLHVLSNLSRAAGGAGDRTAFYSVRDEIWRLVRSPETVMSGAQALTDHAWGAVSLGDWAEAEEAARVALELATERGQHQVAVTAETILEEVRSDRLAKSSVRAMEVTQDVSSLATDLVRTLDEYAAVA